jgi:hypothetical protein
VSASMVFTPKLSLGEFVQRQMEWEYFVSGRHSNQLPAPVDDEGSPTIQRADCDEKSGGDMELANRCVP